jgi:hypothetical protein
MNMFVGSAAVVGAAALPCQPAAAKAALTIDTAHASQELVDLIRALDEVHEVLKEKQEAYDGVHEQWLIWSKAHPEPRKYGTRTYRKWNKWHDRVMEEIGFYDARDAKMDAAKVQQEARLAVAKFESRHLNDTALKVAAAVVFEGGGEHDIGYRGAIICQGITIDLMRMSLAGSYPVLN